MTDSGSDPVDALIGTWRTEGAIAGGGTIAGFDTYEKLGPFVVHRAEVTMDGEPVRSLEMIGPRAPDGSYPTRGYDGSGGEQTSVATVDADGVWTFGADGARATLHVDPDGTSMRADWVRSEDDGATWHPWLRLRFTRLSATVANPLAD